MTGVGSICVWRLDSDEWNGDSWDTECGDKFQFTVDGPVENGFRYCPYCGGGLSGDSADRGRDD